MKNSLIVKGVIGILGTAFLLSGCGLIYTNIRVPYAYRSATATDVHSDKTDPAVSGEACNQSLLFLVSWGQGGYASACQKALEPYPGTSLYDVKTDMKVKSILLGLYTRTCTVVTGKAAKP